MTNARRRQLFFGLCAMLCGPCTVAASPLAHLRDLQLNADDHSAVLQLTQRVRYHYFTLAHPTRLVLDLADTGPSDVPTAALRTARITSVRIGMHHRHDLRIVFALGSGDPADANVSETPEASGEQLAVQFAPAAGPGPNDIPHTGVAPAPSPAHRPPTQQPVRYRAVPRHGPMVVEIDPGHGGSDPGTTGPHGLHEKTVTLEIGREVYRLLNKTPHVRAYLTRHADYYVSLHRRVLEAQAHHADVYVSIHENAFPGVPRVRGGTCYALSQHGASDAEAAQLAREENAADPEIAGVDFSHHSPILNKVLTDLYQRASILAGDHLADDIIRQFARVEPIYRRSVQHANFAVLRDPMIPSVLCETAFLSNPTQARELHHRHFRDALAHAIYRGLLQYLHKHVPMQLTAAPLRRYVVQPGDTLSAIADHFSVSMRRIEAVNGLQDTAIHTGQTLRIPTAGNS